MKIEMSRDEVKEACLSWARIVVPGDWQMTTSDYNFPHSVEMVLLNAEQRAQRAKDDAEAARIAAEWEAKAKAEADKAA